MDFLLLSVNPVASLLMGNCRSEGFLQSLNLDSCLLCLKATFFQPSTLESLNI